MDHLTLALSIASGLGLAENRRNLEGELGRFPHPAVVVRHHEMATEHLKWIDGQFGRNHDYSRLQRRLIIAYEALEMARRQDQSYSGRRRSADELRRLIGRDYYNVGRLPMPLPVMAKKAP